MKHMTLASTTQANARSPDHKTSLIHPKVWFGSIALEPDGCVAQLTTCEQCSIVSQPYGIPGMHRRFLTQLALQAVLSAFGWCPAVM